MDATKTMEALNASAETANEAAETALLASESIVALGSKMGDEVRHAIQQALESAAATTAPQPSAAPIDNDALVEAIRNSVEETLRSTPRQAVAEFDPQPLVDQVRVAVNSTVKNALAKPEEEEEQPGLGQHAPLIAGVLTLCGVGYLSLQHTELVELMDEQIVKTAAIDEQIQVNIGESASQVMLLAQQNQKIEEALQSLTSKPKPEESSAEPEKKSAELIALEQLTGQLDTLQQSLEQQIQQARMVAEASSTPAPAAAPSPEPTTETRSDITLDGIRTTLKEELTPLHTTLEGVKQQLEEQASQPVPLQPISQPSTSYNSEDRPTVKRQGFDNSKPRVYRFP